MPSDAESRIERNWRSVASSALSGMLLMSPIVMHLLDRSRKVAGGLFVRAVSQ
jgi:hypothetical protein